MSSLGSVEAQLPPGFRFHPKDEELICEYLIRWISGCPHPFPSLINVDLNKCEPWDIPESACVGGKEWYFYNQRDRKYATGLRMNRATMSGYWKATGKDRPVVQKGTLVGMRKTLVFYQGRAPKGKKTNWVMHEFRLHGPGPKTTLPVKDQDWVLCRVFFKSRRDLIPSKQGVTTAGAHVQETTSPSSPSQLPGLMNQPYMTPSELQVPCFSIFNQLTNPNNSSHYPDPLLPAPSRITMPEYFEINHGSSFLTEMAISGNNDNYEMIKGSPISFGEAAGSSDSYLSSSSMWINHYQS